MQRRQSHTSRGMLLSTLLSFLILLVQQSNEVTAILQSAAVDVSLRDGTMYTLLASQAFFGSMPAEGASKNEGRRLMIPPDENALLCQNVTTTAKQTSWTGSTILVPRGTCTFEMKAWNAQRLGAAGILVYGTLASRYSLNETKYINQTDPQYTEADIVYPNNYYDYDCSFGRAEVPASAIKLDPPPYNSQNNDPVLSGSSPANLCQRNAPDALASCDSQSCLLTGKTVKDGTMMEACCAWDFHIWLYLDPTFSPAAVTIPAAYITAQQGRKLKQHLQKQSQVFVTLYSRSRPNYNLSSVLIWMLGVAVAALAAYMSADGYHRLIRRTLRKQERAVHRANNHTNNTPSSSYSDDPTMDQNHETNNHRAISRPRSPSSQQRAQQQQQGDGIDSNDNALEANNSTTTAAGSKPDSNNNNNPPPPMPFDDSLELTVWHALGFVVMASSGLFILFFFKIYNVVKIFYAIGCSKAVSQVIFFPLCWRMARRMQYRDRIVWRTNTEDFGDITVLDIVSHVMGYALGIAWIVVCFTVRHPEDITFFWVMQDIMGACMCITFLEVIKLNSLKVAATLLTVAFFYDIFFVFVTPFLFKGKSIMITVATSGGAPEADPAWCEKYPDDSNCQGGDPLPMLFTIPRIGDYQGGSSLLGLGDIVLPGLLLSFAARLDAAKSLLGILGGGKGALNCAYGCPEQKYCGGCRLCSGGYFIPSVIAYAVGLLMANMAVYLMQMGQPALLYLVPCCVGTMSFMAWRRNELTSLWEGPKAIRTVDAMLYGDNHAVSNNQHAPLPVEEGQEAQPVPSAEDVDGDVPLLHVVSGERSRNVV